MEPTVAKPLLGDLESIRKAVVSAVNSTGFLVPTVDPLDWHTTQPDYRGEDFQKGGELIEMHY